MRAAHLKLVHDADAPIRIVSERFEAAVSRRDIEWTALQARARAYQRELERETLYIVTIFCTIAVIWTASITWAIWGGR